MLNHDALKKRRAGSRTGTGWKPREGSNKIRILPPRSAYLTAWEKMEDLSIGYKIHFFRVEGRPTEVTRCLEELKQRCPACDMWRAYRKSEDQGLKEMARQVAPADQYLFNVLDVNNLQSGIQAWAANYTCWDKIMEIAANPAWGNVVDPANGVNFEITLTPGARSRTGFNQYSVTPEPQRTTVMEILQGVEDWQGSIDSLEDQISAPKTADEIAALLEEMGFPPPSGGGRKTTAVPAAVPSAVPAVAAAPAPPAPAPALPTVGLTAPQPVVSVSAPAPASPSAAPVAVPAVAPTPAPEAERHVDVSSVLAAGVHYDPGPAYTPKVVEAERPEKAPRCFGDYEPKVHRCQPCPVVADCQLRLLGIR